MPRGDEITTKFRVDISDLKKGITEANNQIKLANAQFKAASSGMDDWQKSAEGIRAKLDQLGSVLDAQKTKLSNYAKELERTEKGAEENRKRADELRKILQELSDKGVSKTSEEYKKYSKELSDCEKEQVQNEKSAERLRVTLLNQQAEVNRTEKEIQGYNKSLDDLEKESGEAKWTLEDLTDQTGKSAEGFTVMKGALAGLVADGIRNAINAFKDFAKETIEVGKAFESSMSNVQALSGASGKELEDLRKTAKYYGSTTRFSATEAADALGYMALAGWDAEESQEGLPGVLNLAAASSMDLAEASDMVTDNLSAFQMGAEDAAYFSDVLAYAQANANTTTEGLGEAFQNCAANMSATGQSFETTTSLLGIMSNSGLKGSRAGTALSAMARDLTKSMDVLANETEMAKFAADGYTSSTGDLNDVLGKNFIAIGDTLIPVSDANGNYRDMIDILKDVEKATDSMGEAEKNAALQNVFTSDSIKGVNTILGAGAQEAAYFKQELEGASVTSNGLAKAAADSGIDLDGFKAKLEEAGVSSEDFDYALQMSRGSSDLFIEALGEMTNQGYNIDDILSELKISTDDLAAAFENSTGTAEEMSALMQDNLDGDLTSLQSKFEGLQIELYEKVEPAIRGVVKVGGKLLDNFQWIIDNADLVEMLLLAVAAALGTYVAYSTGVQILTKGFASLEWVQKAVTAAQWLMNAAMNANPISILIGLLLALVAAFVVLWVKSEDFRNFFIGMWDKIKNTVKNAVGAIADFMSWLWDTITEKFSQMGSFVGDAIGGAVRGAINGVLSIVEGTINNAVGIINGAIGLINRIPGVSIGRVSGVYLPRLEKGGILEKGQTGYLEGNGAEAVVPLERNKKWIRRVAHDMASEFGYGGGNSVNNNSSQVFNMTVNTPKAPSRLEIYRQTKRLLALART